MDRGRASTFGFGTPDALIMTVLVSWVVIAVTGGGDHR
jgi:hypothetical protein